MAMAEGCMGRNKDGGPCGAQALRDGWCRWHHPDLDAERAEWRRKGGEGRSTANRAGKRLPKTLQDVQGALLRALAAVEAGELEPARANAMAGLGRAVVVVAEYATLETRIADLERAAGIAEGRAS